ncbi:MAG TPA: bifunctional DedA family/phosphatase PAP2 family protein [Gemmatimonadales bacterium]|nr:bifunctional DedA family/phosphatase PAP2 family protein [Gemmatimonadales bacterium]
MLNLVARYGYVVVALFVGAEGIGLPLPGETALVLAAAVAAQGRLSLDGVIAAAALGAVLGDTGGYWIGRGAGRMLLERPPRWISPGALARLRGYFDRHGAATVLFARFVAFFRTVVGILAGASGMPFGRFSVFNALGSVLWAVAVGSVGYFFGQNLPRLQRALGRAGLAVALFIALVVALVVAGRWFEAHLESLRARVWASWDRLAARYPRGRQFLSARLARGQYLGLHLTLGLGASLLSLWLFIEITEGLFTRTGFTRFDVALAAWFRANATPAGDALAAAISALGSPAAIVLVGLGVALWLGSGRRWPELGAWVTGIVGASALNEALKLLVRRPRSPAGAAGLSVPGFSFPSGHAMEALVCFGLLAYFVIGRTARPSGRIAAGVAAISLVAAIGFSRMYLGVHYFSDVVGGYTAGIVWLAVCVSGLEIVRRRRLPAQ